MHCPVARKAGCFTNQPNLYRVPSLLGLFNSSCPGCFRNPGQPEAKQLNPTMRLLNTETLELSRLYVPSEVPDYAILSHRWSTEEVTFADISSAPILHPQSQTQTKKALRRYKELAS